MGSSLVGKVAKCQKDIIGIISKAVRCWNEDDGGFYIYYGITLDGKPWQAKHPKVIADSVNEYYVNQFKLMQPEEVGQNL